MKEMIILKACYIFLVTSLDFVPNVDDDIVINIKHKKGKTTRRTFNEANEKLMIILLFINNRQPCMA